MAPNDAETLWLLGEEFQGIKKAPGRSFYCKVSNCTILGIIGEG